MAYIKGYGCASYEVVFSLELAYQGQKFNLLVAQDFFVEHSD